VRMKVLLIFIVLLSAAFALGQADVIGDHDLSPGGSGTPGNPTGTVSGSCLYCHVPHSGQEGRAGGNGTIVAGSPLWRQTLSTQTYTPYKSTTNQGNPNPPLGSDSTLCLSCHDGTVALGSGAPNSIPVSGSVTHVVGPDMSSVHPFSLVLPINQDSTGTLVPSLTQQPASTADASGAVKLINGNIECTTCHNPHIQSITPGDPNFLVKDNSTGAICEACHTTTETADPMKLSANRAGMSRLSASTRSSSLSLASPQSKTNPLAGWSTSSHATASNRVARRIPTQPVLGVASKRAVSSISAGTYGTVGRNGCASCHSTHNAQGGKALLSASEDQTCLSCHNGSSSVSPAPANIVAEMTAPKNGHALGVGNSPHQVNEPALLNQSRHSNCVDCHNPHSSSQIQTFPAAPTIRASQGRVAGISATDGTTVLSPAINQYENCLRCHGNSAGKQARTQFGYLPARLVAGADTLDILPGFSVSATSSHPVMHDRYSAFAQPSLRSTILSLDGRTPARSMGTRILCTDCHNSDDNREFGGKGPNGPHGSIFPHILERRYEFSQTPAPGKPITNLFPNPSLNAEGGQIGGPYALCAKCHDLNKIMSNSSFSEHARHVNDGFSCSVCHTAHGMSGQSAGVTGERMVNFDIQVVAADGSAPITYNRATNSCSLVCHGHSHRGVSAPAAKALSR